MRAHGRGGRGDRDRDRFMGGRGRGGGGGYVGRDKVRFRRGNGSTETPWLTQRRRLATLSSFVSRTADDADRYFPRRFCPRTRADSASPDRLDTADERPDDGHREQAVGAETREPAEHEEGTRGTRNANRKPNVSVSMSKKTKFCSFVETSCLPRVRDSRFSRRRTARVRRLPKRPAREA